MKDIEREGLDGSNLAPISVQSRTFVNAVLTCRGPLKARKF